MPFITQDRRDVIDYESTHDYPWVNGTDWQVGDLCYVHYSKMVAQWKANPRWTTAHEIYKNLFPESDAIVVADEQVAKELAWQVFFQLHVMPYELKKRAENGDI
jgi:hypothetical protein